MAVSEWLLTKGWSVKYRVEFHTFAGMNYFPKQAKLTQNAFIEQNKEKLSQLLNAFLNRYSTVIRVSWDYYVDYLVKVYDNKKLKSEN